MIDAIHIGDYKTGTTWLQEHVFRKHPELIYLDNPRQFPEIARLFYELVDARDLDFNPVSLAERFRREIDGIDRSGRKLVVSREALSGQFLSGDHAGRIAQRLRQVFGEGVKILLVIREQFSMLPSVYSEYVKIGGTLPFDDFVWDPLVAKNLIGRLQYQKKVEALKELFGEDRVSVRLYEELRRDREAFLKGILSFLGCREIGFSPAAGTSNPSLTSFGIAVQRRLNRLVRTEWNPCGSPIPLDRMIAPLLSGRQREKLLDNARMQLPGAPIEHNPRQFLLYSINMALNARLSRCCERIGFGRKLEVSPQLREKLAPLFLPGNRALAEKHGLELQRYGWSL